jgi:hypothetical protein
VISHQIHEVAFFLDLPQHMHLHPVFNVSLLKPYVISSIPDRVVPSPPPIQLIDRPEYEVFSILDSKLICNKLYYLIDWVGYTPKNRKWELVENVTNALELLKTFHHCYPDKSNPSSCITTCGTCQRRE